ncbi:MAG TPA: hypothetical protein VIJ57_09230, partial [Hanamia sp.]
MDKNEIIRLINFFNKIEIVEDDVTTPEEKENGQLVLKVTYKYDGKDYKTNRLYYKDISEQDYVKNAADVIEHFGSQVYWLDVDKHKWPNQNPQLDDIITDIFGTLNSEFKKLNQNISAFTFEGKSPRYGRNLETNNHWHDIIKLIQAYINAKGHNIINKHFSRMVYNWHNDERCKLHKGYGFLQCLQNNIKMVQAELQHEKIKSLLEKNFQIILQGPPGTGKTRIAKDIAYSLITNKTLPEDENERKNKLNELSGNEQYRGQYKL